MLSFTSYTTKDIILHPNTYNMGTGNSSLELWNKGNTVTTMNNSVVHKTIYSVAPCDYKEPRVAAFTGFTLANTYGVYNKGWYFYCNPDKTGGTIFFPNTYGYRGEENPLINTQLGWGHYWTAGPASTTSASCIAVNTNGDIRINVADVRYHAFDMRLDHE